MTVSVSTHGIDASELRKLSAPLVNHQQLEIPPAQQATPLLTGYMKVTELEPGMRLRLADVQDHFGLTSRAELPAGVKIALVVDGAARVRYGQQETELGPSAGSTGLVVVMPRADHFERQGRPESFERTLTLSLTPQWLVRHGLGRLLEPTDGTKPHLCHWTPSTQLLFNAWKLFNQPPEYNNPLYQMQLNGFALSLASEALSHVHSRSQPAFEPLPDAGNLHDRRLVRLMNLIDSGRARHATQADLASHLGMSLSNLQRRFRAQYGEALGYYLRRHYLGVAREALMRDRVSVETAADLAGYTSAPNFATAFRREFGITPSDCRGPEPRQ